MIVRLVALIATALIPFAAFASSAQIYSLALLHSYGIHPYTDSALIEHLKWDIFGTQEFEKFVQDEFASRPKLENDLLIWSNTMGTTPTRRTSDLTAQAIQRVNRYFRKARKVDSLVLSELQERLYDTRPALDPEAYVSISALISHPKARDQITPGTLASHRRILKSIFAEKRDGLAPLFNDPKYRERLLEFPVVLQRPSSQLPDDFSTAIEGIRSGSDAPAGWKKINEWVQPNVVSAARFSNAMIPLLENYPDLLNGASRESQDLIKTLFTSLERYRGDLGGSALLAFGEIARRLPIPFDAAIAGVLLGRFNAEHGHALVLLNAPSDHPGVSLHSVMTLSEWVSSLPRQVKIDWDADSTDSYSQHVQATVRRRFQDPSPSLKIGPDAFLNFARYQPKAAQENAFDFFKNEFVDLLFASKPETIPANVASILSRIHANGSDWAPPFYDAIAEKRVPDVWVDYLISRCPTDHPLWDRLAFHRAARKLRVGSGDWQMIYRNDATFREAFDGYFRRLRSLPDSLIQAFTHDEALRSFVAGAGSSSLPPLVSQNADEIFEGMIRAPSSGNALAAMEFNEQIFAWFLESKTLSVQRKLFFVERFSAFAEAKYAEIPETMMPEIWKRKIVEARNRLIEKNISEIFESIRQARPCKWMVESSSLTSDPYQFSLN